MGDVLLRWVTTFDGTGERAHLVAGKGTVLLVANRSPAARPLRGTEKGAIAFLRFAILSRQQFIEI